MAEYINMQQAEYDEVQVSLLALHEEILQAEKEIRDAVWSLISYEGGLYLKGMSFSVMDFLVKIMLIESALQNDFNSSERVIAEFIATVIEADVAST